MLFKLINSSSLRLKTISSSLLQINRSYLNQNHTNFIINKIYPHLTQNISHFQTIKAFSSSTFQLWKSIGSIKKNRKTRSKLKTHQGAAKRFFVTGRGQFKRVQTGTQHLMTGLRHGRKRRLKSMIIVNKSHSNLLRKLLPYAGKRAGFRRLDQTETVWWKSGKLQKTGQALKLAIARATNNQLNQKDLPV